MSSRVDHHPIRLPANFTVPARLDTAMFRLRPLTTAFAESDYAAVMETQQRLRAGAPNGWPRPGFTLAENHADLAHHQQEFDEGISFAYTVLTPDAVEVIGCVYLNPPEAAQDDVDVHMWVRESLWNSGLAQQLHAAVDSWLRNTWGFERVRYRRPEYYFACGECLCGAVAYHAGPLLGPFELCHCNRCRRASGSAFVAGIRVGEVRFIRGEASIRVCELPVRDTPPAYRSIFCAHCGSPVPDPAETGAQEIAAGSLTPQPMRPDRHIHVEFSPAWALFEDGLPRFTGREIQHHRAAQESFSGSGKE